MKRVMIILTGCLIALSSGNVKALPSAGEEGGVEKKESANYAIFVIKSPVTDEKFLATASLRDVEKSKNLEKSNPADRPSYPLKEGSNLLSIFACRGEYEPASFVIYARQGLNQIKITASDLKSRERIIPATDID